MQLVPSTVENSREDLYPGSVGIGMDSKLSRRPLYRNWIDSLETSVKGEKFKVILSSLKSTYANHRK